MATIYRLENTIQHYDWGSHTDIRGLLGTPDSGKPEAELWLGAHPSAPSVATPWNTTTCHSAASANARRAQNPRYPSTPEPQSGVSKPRGVPLDQLIKQHPVEMLGERVLDKFGPRLPYLMKVLAAEKALSLQVHPASHLARAGFNRENRQGVPIDAPFRNYKDANHKPEMIVAVTEFHALAGLRAPRVVLRMLEGLAGQVFDIVRAPLTANPNAKGMESAFSELLGHRDNLNMVNALEMGLASIKERIATGSQYEVADQTVIDLAMQYPGDVGVLAPYLLNRVTLLPGEAIFMDDGEVHAYIKGLGVEIMANSDNVLRAGLTSKHVDVPELLECMSFQYKMPFRPDQYESGEVSRSVNYRPPSEEFALTMFDLNASEPLAIHATGPRVLVVMDGAATLRYGGTAGLAVETPVHTMNGRPMSGVIPKVTGQPLAEIALRRGDSIFIPDAVGAGELTGSAQLAGAWVP